ncbi:MAG: branched-chain amino acid ABC transporter permease [Candidatus Pacearchaeota archaeon]
MAPVSQLLFNGIIAGAIYALVAAGFSLIYSTNKFIHFAHGSTVAFGGYFLYFFFSELGVNFGFSVLFAVILAAGLGVAMNYAVYKPIRKKQGSPVIMLIASVALLILLESLIIILFGASVKSIGFLEVSKGIEILGAIITPLQIFIVGSSVVLFGSLFFLIKKTKIGKAMRAVADNKDVAEVLGISSEKIYLWTFIVGSAIAGIAGILIGMEQNLDPTMGTNLMIKGLAAAIIGGIGNVYAAVLGAFFLGIVENIGIWYLPSGYKDAIAFAILFLFLIIKPEGILGKRQRET